ncbi:MAG: ABC transporter permease subunit [Tenericutes bacterium]|jgi:glycine betaine/proline transport system permease protein|nr:ABC transporter permease subunit [Mycoplasmatota bacterium]
MLNFINLPAIPFGDWFETFIDFLVDNFSGFFDFISYLIDNLVIIFETVLSFPPSLVLALLFAVLAYFVSNKWLAIGTFIGLLLIDSIGLWDSAIETLALVLVSSVLALLLGIPIGIVAAKYKKFGNKIVRPILDFMQTMPAFVYLIPAVILFSTGNPSGVIATIIFAMPPVVRLTKLGIEQVPAEVTEAAKSMGSTSQQMLLKVQLPVAMPTILAGINQTIMLSLSMVVIASMIGAKGLGADVRTALSTVNIAEGFEAGIAVVILAMVLDRMTQALGKNKKKSTQ